MSALRGLANSAGRIPIAVGGVIATGFRAMGFTAASALATVAEAAQARAGFNGTVNVDAASRVITDTVGAISVRNGGIPLTATGALCTEVAVPTVYDQGVGFTAAGRVAVV